MSDPVSGLLLPLVNAHLARATGSFTAAWGDGELQVYLLGGVVTHFAGPPEMLRAIAPAGLKLTGDLGRDLAALFGAGVGVAAALDGAAEALGRQLAQIVEMPRARSGFMPTNTSPEGAIPLPYTLPRILAQGFKTVRGSHAPERAFRRYHQHSVKPINDRVAELADASAARIYRQARNEPSLLTLIGTFSSGNPGRIDEAWRALDLLLHMGALALGAPVPKTAATPVDHSARVEEFRAMARAVREQHPFAALEIPKDEPVDKITRDRIESAFRALASRFHPDRLAGEPPEVREAAVEVFSALQEKRSALERPEVLKEAKDRHALEARGEVYVSDLDRERARVLYRKALSAERTRNWASCRDLARQAIAVDPKQAEYHLLALFCEALLKDRSPESAVTAIAALKFEPPRAQADAAWRQGWLLRIAGRNREAHQALKKALELVPDHFDARSELRALERQVSGKS